MEEKCSLAVLLVELTNLNELSKTTYILLLPFVLVGPKDT